MGWTGLYDKPASIPEYFKERWTQPRADGSYLTCEGQAFVGRFTLYGVWYHHAPDGTIKNSFATVVLIRYGGKNDLCRWYYKDMDESVGPCEDKMPLTLLKKLRHPAFNEYAKSWRKACWRNALGVSREGAKAKMKRAWRARKPLKVWQIAKFYYTHNPGAPDLLQQAHFYNPVTRCMETWRFTREATVKGDHP